MSGSAIFFQEEEQQDNPRSRRKPDHANPIMKKRSSRVDPPPTSLPAGELFSWQNASSRIIRVSRVSGGKDRHSKVWTVKGLRDRRVRLSVSTSIQFYDLQDRLGLDQPSKAVDWLINAAAPAIVHLPELQAPFPVPPLFAIPVLSRKSLKQQQQPTTRSPAPPVDFACGSVSEYLMREAGIPQIETSSFSSFLQYGSNPNMGLGMMAYNPVHLGEHQDLHRFSIMQDHVISPDVSSGIAGFGRETLQSNSQHLHHLAHGGNLPFFVSGAIPVAAAGAAGSLTENQFNGGFNGHLQLFCNEAYMYPELKGERKG